MSGNDQFVEQGWQPSHGPADGAESEGTKLTRKEGERTTKRQCTHGRCEDDGGKMVCGPNMETIKGEKSKMKLCQVG